MNHAPIRLDLNCRPEQLDMNYSQLGLKQHIFAQHFGHRLGRIQIIAGLVHDADPLESTRDRGLDRAVDRIARFIVGAPLGQAIRSADMNIEAAIWLQALHRDLNMQRPLAHNEAQRLGVRPRGLIQRNDHIGATQRQPQQLDALNQRIAAD
jgi:hypothetical protein